MRRLARSVVLLGVFGVAAMQIGPPAAHTGHKVSGTSSYSARMVAGSSWYSVRRAAN